MDSAMEHPDPAFPRLHPRPPQGWTGAPCGLSYLYGRYHVFVQHNPDPAYPHRIGWAHLSSPDLVRWRQEPLALRPQPGGPDAGGCGPGAVIDDDGVPTAAYTGLPDGAGSSGGSAKPPVVLAHGSSDLTLWAQEGQVAAPAPENPRITVVRDPSVFVFHGRRYALQGAGLASGHAAALLYSLDDLRSWHYEGIWLTSADGPAADHLAAGSWEGPQLVELPDSSGAESWLLMVTLRNTGAGETAGASGDPHRTGVGYLLGVLAAHAVTGLPVFAPAAGGTADFGPDFTAPQILSLPDRALLWGWARELESGAAPGQEGMGVRNRQGRSRQEILTAGWSGVLTFPRRLSVHGGALAVEPAAELAAYRGITLRTNAAGTLDLPRQAEVHVTGGEGELRLELAAPSSNRTIFAETVAGGDDLRIFVDSSIVEVYRHGAVAATVRAYPGAGEGWRLMLPHGAAATVWELRVPDP